MTSNLYCALPEFQGVVTEFWRDHYTDRLGQNSTNLSSVSLKTLNLPMTNTSSSNSIDLNTYNWQLSYVVKVEPYITHCAHTERKHYTEKLYFLMRRSQRFILFACLPACLCICPSLHDVALEPNILGGHMAIKNT